MCSNFRVSGLSFDGHFTPEVGLPTVGLVHGAADLRRPERAVASLALAELRLQIAARSTGLVMAWVRKWVVDNCVGTGKALSLNVELLDAAPKQVLARFQPTGCEIAGLRRGVAGRYRRAQRRHHATFCAAAARLAGRLAGRRLSGTPRDSRRVGDSPAAGGQHNTQAPVRKAAPRANYGRHSLKVHL